MKYILLAITLLVIFVAPASALNWVNETVDNTGYIVRFTSLDFDSSGNPAISYCDETERDLKYAYYNGTGWEIEIVDRVGNTGYDLSFMFDDSGNPAISYRYGNNNDLKYAYHNGTGWELETVDSVGNVGHLTSLAFDDSSNPAISYYDNTNYDLKYASFNGTGWELATVDSEGNVGQYSSLAFDNSGNPAISYRNGTSGDLKYASYNGTGWEFETLDGPASDTSLAFDSSGYPAISYYHNDHHELKYAYYNGTGWGIEIIDTEVDVGPYSSLDFNSSGNPAISYRDRSNGNLKYAFYNGSGWEIETVDNSGNVDYDTSLAFDSSGNPAISYCDDTNYALKYTYVSTTGTLTVNSSVTGAWVYVNGTNQSVQTNTTLTLQMGTYNVTVYKDHYITPANQTVSVVAGSNSDVGFELTPASPVSDFTANTTSGSAPVSVSFTDLSVGIVDSWFWDFDDGNTSTDQNPIHMYSSAGTYNVSLNVTNAGSSNISSQVDYITVRISPVADFTSNVTSGAAPLTVGFSDTSGNEPSDWLWNFGDGNTSTEQNPEHTYVAAGTYTVILAATNIAGTDVENKTSFITVAIAPVSNFTANVTSGTAPLIVSFTDLSTNTPTSWLWDFGDGSNSTVQNPTHSYSAAGTYNVTLNVTNVAGSNVSTRTVYITVTTESSTAPVSDSNHRISIGPGMDPGNVHTSDTSVMHVIRGKGVEFDLSSRDDPVVSINFNAKENEGHVVAKVQVLKERPVDLPESHGRSYSIMSIDVGAEGTISEDNADNLRIRFKVSREWTRQNNIDVSTIHMNRYHGEQWNDLPTYQEGEDDEYIYFYAETPGFSIFEVVGDEISVVSEQIPASSSVTEEEAGAIDKESPGIPGFTSIVGIVVISLVFFVSRKLKLE